MDIQPIKSEKDFLIALKKLEKVFDAEPNTSEGDEAEILTVLIENYEDRNYPIEAPDSISVSNRRF